MDGVGDLEHFLCRRVEGKPHSIQATQGSDLPEVQLAK